MKGLEETFDRYCDNLGCDLGIMCCSLYINYLNKVVL